MSEAESKLPRVPISTSSETKWKPVKFVHEKSPHFRIYHADGVWGTVNAHGEIHANFFSEHPEISPGIINKIDPDKGTYTGEYEILEVSDPKYFVTIREFQCCVVLSIPTAEAVYGLLGNFIKVAKESVADQKSREQKK